MREILFRGKRKDNGEWVEGNLVLSPNADESYQAIVIPCYYNYMYTSDYNNDVGFETWYKVYPETVGQFTGLIDKNGKKIFEGDILEGKFGYYRVYFDESFCRFDWECFKGVYFDDFSGFADEYKIIGNIHDNPELLKGDK